MELMFLGAAHEVTGSCTLLSFDNKNILIDCGMEQGKNLYKNCDWPIEPNQIDCLLLTHAHIDHSGKIPYLYKNGFKGKIYSTKSTARLCGIMLQDSAHIQEFEAEWKNRKAKRAGEDILIPLYTVKDAIAVMKQFQLCNYNDEIKIYDNLKIKFIDAGHLLGSSGIEITVTESGETKKIIFSGDIGNTDQPIIRDPQFNMLDTADYIITESTYGNKLHDKRIDYVSQLVPIFQRTFDRGGNVVIPSFAVGRTQELLYFIREIKENNLINGHAEFPVYVDSPLAAEATHIFSESMEDFDDKTNALIRRGINPINFPKLILSITSDDSKAINFDKTPKVIISASGMCDAGRIRHHLKYNLWRNDSTILFVGYQSAGTIGRALAEGAKEVKLFGEKITVNAEISLMKGISGHADQSGLLKFVESFKNKPIHIFVNHGEDTVTDEYAETIKEKFNIEAHAPYNGEIYSLSENRIIKEGNKHKIEKDISESSHLTSQFVRLLNAGKRLEEVIKNNKYGANKDLAKFTDQIISLCEKWDR